MISFSKIMRQVLTETMSFMDLWRNSDSARKVRATHVKPRSLQVTSMDEDEAWTFSYKSESDWSTTGKRWHGYIRFLKENVEQSDSAKDLQCMVDCNCFSGNTLVLMQDGSYKEIKNVQIGDMVYTHKGRIKRVSNTLKKKIDINENVYKIKITGFPGEIIATGDHPFYNLRGNDNCLCGCNTSIWEGVYSHKCSSPDLILGNKYARGHAKKQIINLQDNSDGIFKWIPVNDFRQHEWFLSPWLEPTNDDFDVDFARLIGYYISEGCIPSYKGTTVRLTFNINELDTLGKDVLNICNKLKLNAHIFKSNHGNWFDVRINDRNFKEFCNKHIGKGSNNKKISLELMNLNNNALKNIFIGAILGDGWIDPQKGMKYVSINFNLISQISTILNKLKIRHNISILNNNTQKNKNKTYQVIIPRGHDAEQVREWLFPYLREKDKFISSQEDIRSKHHNRYEGHLKSMRLYEKIKFNDFVYDITVEDDESFIANGIAVHNCPDYRFRWAYRNAEAGAGITGPNSWNKNNGNPPKYPQTDLGTGLCKHLISLGEHLKTQIEPESPEEPAATPDIKQPIASVPISKLGMAPEPPEKKKKFPTFKPSYYSDTRAGDLMEIKETLSNKIKTFVDNNPQFEVNYE